MKVPSQRIKNAQVAWVGEAPGEVEHLNGRPFIGKSGRLFDRLLRIGGFKREAQWVGNVVTRAPDGGFDSEAFRRTFYKKESELTITVAKILKKGLWKWKVKRGKVKVVPTDELLAERERLKKELTEDRPNLVVALGSEALKTLVADAPPISVARGSVYESTLVPGLKVIPLIHPSGILRGAMWQEYFITGALMKRKIASEASFPQIKKDGWITIEPTIEHIKAVTDHIGKTDVTWTLDIETRGGSIACIGIGFLAREPATAICIPIQTTQGPYWSVEQELQVWKMIHRAMENPNLIGQNILFDLYWLMEDYGVLPSGVLMDTMLAFHSMYPELPKSLAFLTMWYTSIPYYKDEGKTWASRTPDQSLWAYNIKDIIAQLRVGRALMEEMKERDAWTHYSGFVNPQLTIALEMMRNGFPAREEEIPKVRGIVERELHRINQLFVKEYGDINTGSPKAVSGLLYGTLGMKPKINRKTHTVTADEDAIMELIGEHPEHKALEYILAERRLRKSLESYIEVKLYDENVL